jgi:hypothetical protein
MKMDRTATRKEHIATPRFHDDLRARVARYAFCFDGTRDARRLLIATAALIALAATPAVARAATVHVAGNGSDGPGCGAPDSPCRTISQGIAVAAAGDRVLVLPGVYGDVDGDGEFESPGDEPAQYDEGCHCLIAIDKPVTVVSQAGAGATILRGAVDDLWAVVVDAPNVTFGKKKGGFTIVGDLQHDGRGIRVNASATGTRIQGNVLSRLEQGMFVAGNGTLVGANRLSEIFSQAIHVEGTGTTVSANVVEQTGMPASNDSAIHVVGFDGAGHVVARNLVVGNHGIGIYVDDGAGRASGSPHSVTKNLVVNNGAAGIKVVLASTSGGATVTGNTIYGNDYETGTNCGLMTLSAGPAIDATNNYWGGAGGPGADPKDDVCSVGTPPNGEGAAPTAFSIVAPPLR